MESYPKAMQRHLAAYKLQQLRVLEDGIYLYRGREVRHAHILPDPDKWLNLLEPIRASVQSYLRVKSHIKLHRYFHHLTSSQAFALNLFYPFMEEKSRVASTALLNALCRPGNVRDWYPEFVEDVEEGTNVDVAWVDTNDSWTYCEVKLTESGFGTGNEDRRHREKLNDIYEPVLRACCSSRLLEYPKFLENYQILRNIWLAARNERAHVVFLMPSLNRNLWKALAAVLPEIESSLRSRIHLVAMEDVIDRLMRDTTLPPKWQAYPTLLQEKYVLPVLATMVEG